MNRAEYLTEWRKKNPDKVKIHSMKANSKYWGKHWKKYADRKKIDYHIWQIQNATPWESYCSECMESALPIHKHFPKHWPVLFWRGGCTNDQLTNKELERNRKYAAELQKQGRIIQFKIPTVKTFLQWREKQKQYDDEIDELKRKVEDWQYKTGREKMDMSQVIHEYFSCESYPPQEKQIEVIK